VDGDLPPGERHRLLAALADEPGGWQRCALAFLEAQSWRRACRELVAEPGNGSRDPEVSPARPRSRHFFQRRGDLVRLSASIAAGAVVLGVVFCGGLAAGRAWPASSPLMADERSSQTGANPDGVQGSMRTAIVGANRNSSDGNRKHARTVVQLLGIIHVPGEDGARLAVPILAAPGLKVDPPPRQPGTLAAGHRSSPSPGPRHGIPSESSSLDGEPLTLPLLAGQRVAIPADWVNALAQGPSVH
jgi:hypothetical protein